MITPLEINDIVWDNDGNIGRIIELYENTFIIRANGDEYHGENTRPIPLTNDWIIKLNVHEICKKNGILISFSREHKLKVSLLGENDRIIISYFYPKPQYVHELQHLLRYFNKIEL